MKYFFCLLILLLVSCQSTKIKKHMTDRECTDNSNLAFDYYKGFTEEILKLDFEISQGTYGKDDVPAEVEGPKLGISIKKYAYLKGALKAHNLITESLIKGYIAHEQYLLKKKGWSKKKN